MSRARAHPQPVAAARSRWTAPVRLRLRALAAQTRALAPEVAWFAALAAASVLAMSLIFPPRPWWPLALFCLAPWTFACCRASRPWITHWGSFFAGWVFFLINLHWLEPVTGLGYVALAFYLAIYWPLVAWAVRTGRRAGISPTLTLPVAWVACEYLRAWLMTGFPWLFFAHSFYEHIPLIQISDLTGAYGVSFLALLANGAATSAALQAFGPTGGRRRWRGPLLSTAACVAAFGSAYAYGVFRLDEARFRAGPRVAVLQENFPLLVSDLHRDHPFYVFAKYLRLAADAAREQPDLVVFPETVWSLPINIAFVELENPAVDEMSALTHPLSKRYHLAVSALARGAYASANAVIADLEDSMRAPELGRIPGKELPRLPGESGPPATLVVGSTSLELFPAATYPKQKRYNSALIYNPDGTQRRTRYDKIHLVPFGEIVPFRNQRLLGSDLPHRLYRLLNSLSPFSDGGKVEYSLWPGRGYTVFTLPTASGTWRFGTPICYEDVTPYLPRQYVYGPEGRRVDFLVNISNDAWFLHSDELPQHLAACAFRAVENRVAIARAVNTGVSGFIDPNGRIYSLVERDGRAVGPDVVGYRIAEMQIDDRESFYGRRGDWFASLCLALACLLWLGGIVTRWLLAARARLRARLKRAPT